MVYWRAEHQREMSGAPDRRSQRPSRTPSLIRSSTSSRCADPLLWPVPPRLAEGDGDQDENGRIVFTTYSRWSARVRSASFGSVVVRG